MMRKIFKRTAALLAAASCVVLPACSEKGTDAIEAYSKVYKCYIGEVLEIPNAEGHTFSSDNKNVVKVEGNTFTALSQGNAAVTVEAKDGSVAVLLFTVFGEKPVDLNTLTIQGLPEGNSMCVAQDIQLTYAKDPIASDNYQAIVWTTSDESVLSVDRDGKLTAHKMGVADVTLTALGTSVQVTQQITVLPRDTVFRLNHSAVVGLKGTQEDLFVADILTDYSFNGEVEWYSENPAIAQVDEGSISFQEIGETNVGIKAIIDGKEVSYSCKVRVIEDYNQTVIRTPEDLQAIGNYSGDYVLGNDIDMKQACSLGGALYNAGKGFLPLCDSASTAYSGTFDGNGFAIKNLYVNRSNDVFVALFRYISAVKGREGKIINLSLEGGEIYGGNYTAAFYANASGGGSVLCGLENCYSSLKLNSVGSLSGLVGNNKGVVKNCLVNSELDALGDCYLFALNQTAGEGFGVENCVYVGSSEAQAVNLKNGGYSLNNTRITQSQIANFDFSVLGSGWKYTVGELPTIKGDV